MKPITLLALSAALTCSGCATLIKGSSEKLTINSLEEGTTLFVNGAPRGRDNVYVDAKKGKAVTIKASKKGCQDVIIQTNDSFDMTSLLGIFLDFGILSIPIDLISGAAWKFDPSDYTVSPLCPTTPAAAPGSGQAPGAPVNAPVPVAPVTEGV